MSGQRGFGKIAGSVPVVIVSELLSLVSQRAGLVALAVALLALPLIVKLLGRLWRRLWRRLRQRRHVVVDGSNVMHWRDNTPDLQVLRAVVAELKRRGYTPGVVFDANAGWKLMGGYRHDGAMARLLDLPEDQVMVVPKGQVADGWILAAARDLGAPVVTNDRYRDWAEAHPEVMEPGRLIRGGVREGRVWLDLGGRSG